VSLLTTVRTATLNVGQQLQAIETDLDMLTSDFVFHTTTSNRGTRFDDIFSNTHGMIRVLMRRRSID